jgi:hypothetical protein
LTKTFGGSGVVTEGSFESEQGKEEREITQNKRKGKCNKGDEQPVDMVDRGGASFLPSVCVVVCVEIHEPADLELEKR